MLTDRTTFSPIVIKNIVVLLLRTLSSLAWKSAGDEVDDLTSHQPIIELRQTENHIQHELAT